MIDVTHLTHQEALTKLRARISESDFQKNVVACARQIGWRAYHTTIAYRSTPGFPDLVLVKPPRLLFVELKKIGGKTTPAQDVWLEALRACPGAETYLWTPNEWDEIQRVLGGTE